MGLKETSQKKTERKKPGKNEKRQRDTKEKTKSAPAGGSPELLAALAFSAVALVLGTVKGAVEAPRCEGAAWPAWELRSALPATASV